MKKYNVLVMEDDDAIRESIGIYLKTSNYEVFYARDGVEGIEIFQENEIHLIIMDLMMPRMTGEEAIIKLREISYVPIIVLSAKSEDYDKIISLDIGADDYITKPFNPMELIARVNSNIRRCNNYRDDKDAEKDKDKIKVGGIVLDTISKEVIVDGKRESLTSIEYKILKLLMSNLNRVFSVNEIYRHVWEEDALETKTVTVHIKRIREKIEIDSKKPRYLQVAWGLGYKFIDPYKGVENGRKQN